MKVKIALLELAADENQNMPIYMGTDIENKFENGHAENVRKHLDRCITDYIRDRKLPISLDDFDVYLLPKTSAGLRWCINNDIDIVSMSALDWDCVGGDAVKKELIDQYEKPLMKKAFCICGAGNDGRKEEEHEESIASQRGWFSVGAVDSNLKPRVYSSYGLGEVDCVAIDGVDGDNGTSFSAPYACGIFAIYCLMHLRKLGYKPSVDSYYKWSLQNCIDVHDQGWDLKTGYGLLTIPRRWIFKEILFTIGSDIIEEVVYINDNHPIIKMSKADVIPFIKNDRTVLSATDLTMKFGASKYWDDEKKQAHYSIV